MQAEMGDVGFPSSTCDTILQWHVLDPDELPERDASSNSPVGRNLRRFKFHRMQFASDFIAALVGRHQALNVRRMFALSFMLSQQGNASMANAVGNQFERLVHATLPNVPLGGVALKLKMLTGDAKGQEFRLQLPPSVPHVFSAISEAVDHASSDCTVYLMPLSSSFPAINCLMSRKLLLQVRTHSGSAGVDPFR